MTSELHSQVLELAAVSGWGALEFRSHVPLRPAFVFEALDGDLSRVVVGSVCVGNVEQLLQSVPADLFTSAEQHLLLPTLEPHVELRFGFGNTGGPVRFRVWFGPRDAVLRKHSELWLNGFKGGTRS